MQNTSSKNNKISRECSSGRAAVDSQQKRLDVATFYRLDNHSTAPNSQSTPIQENDLPPSYESLYPPWASIESSPPPYQSLPPPPPAYEPLPSPPPYSSLFIPPSPSSPPPLPPPPYSARSSSFICSSCSSLRTILPSLSTLLSSVGSGLSSPPPPPPQPPSPPATPPPTTRFLVYHARYYGTTTAAAAADHGDSSQDRHTLFILTNPGSQDPTARGIHLGMAGGHHQRRRYRPGRGPQLYETPGDTPENTPRLRESTLLGSVAAGDLGALEGVCRQAHSDAFPVPARGGAARKRQPLERQPCRVLLYTVDAPPPPYGNGHAAEPLASPSQEWVAAVIMLAQHGGLLLGY
ncbi:hypothetical protein IF1G_01064 [Cordyceps javanica]|uniref:Uncharacterized protein n=1 Tax=Cordyceps javanica TaxID=43265 RepID=A0A545VHD5_9HYPO|nr:hypothetical protein IF1G_01064 [Cordyceps javanica]TQW12293.1 hypothetical protein IF2G_01024 [Cordyceps javanica]